MIRFIKKNGLTIQINNILPNRLYCVGLYWKGKRIYVEYFSEWDAAYSYFEDMSGEDFDEEVF